MDVFYFEDLVVLSKEEVISVLEKIEEIPTLPAIATKLLKTINNPDFSVGELGKIINFDSAITSKLLRVANSAFYSGESEVTTIEQAIMRLGSNQIRNIVLGISVIKSFTNFNHLNFSITDFWKHSLAVAFLNKIIASLLEMEISDDIWVCGIMHDIGKLIYSIYIPSLMQRLLAEVKNNNCTFFVAEKNILKFNHCEIGRWLCEKWNIPKKIKQVVYNHHNPPINEFMLGEATYFIGINHISDAIIKTSKLGNSGDFIGSIDSNVWNYLDKSKFDTVKLLGMVKGLKKEIEDIFNTLSS